jgi:tRNA(fMet)-specific endonuclease VapC
VSGIFLLDANAAVALLEREIAIREVISQADIVYLCSIVIGELYYGAEKSDRVEANVKRVEAIVAVYPVLDCDEITAVHYGRVKNMLRVKGKPVPPNDLWIAATSIQHSLTLLTRDQHFNNIDELTVQGW